MHVGLTKNHVSLPSELSHLKKVPCDLLGNIALLKFSEGTLVRDRKAFAARFLQEHSSVSTVREKVGKFSGRLRTQTSRWLAGEKTAEALYKENGCVFRFHVDTCYFSPRLSSQRLLLAKKVKRNEDVLVMFGGVAPFAIVMAKYSKAKRVVSVELGRECTKYAQVNVRRNKLQDRVVVVGGDVRKVFDKPFLSAVNSKSSPSLTERERVSSVRKKVLLLKEKFDRIVMARPNLKDSFLDVAFSRIKKGGMIHYYGFYAVEDKAVLKELILTEAKKARKKVKILRVEKAGEVAAYRYRYRADVKVLN